jgi:hypothetical protein
MRFLRPPIPKQTACRRNRFSSFSQPASNRIPAFNAGARLDILQAYAEKSLIGFVGKIESRPTPIF